MNEKINLQELIDILTEKYGLKQAEASDFVKAFWSTIEEALICDGIVKVKGWGTFKLVIVDSRESINVQTGERIEIQQHYKISFIPDVSLRNAINKPFAHFESVILNDDTHFDDINEDVIGDNNDRLDATEEADTEEMAANDETALEVSDRDTEEVAVLEPCEGEVVKVETAEEEVADTAAEEAKPAINNSEEGEMVEPKAEEDESVDSEVEEEVVVEIITGEEEKTETVLEKEDTCVPADTDASLAANVVAEKDVKAEPVMFKSRTSWLFVCVSLVLAGCAIGVFASWLFFYNRQMNVAVAVAEPQGGIIQYSDSAETVRQDTLSIVEEIDNAQNVEKDDKQENTLSESKVKAENKTSVAKETHDKCNVKVSAKTNAKAEGNNIAVKAKNRETLADTVEYEATGTLSSDTIRAGDTLAKIAFRFYGNRKLWPYIVIYNKKTIINPDNVPIGTVIMIPKLQPKR